MTSTAIVGHQTLVSHVLFALRARLTSCFTCQWLVIITREKLGFTRQLSAKKEYDLERIHFCWLPHKHEEENHSSLCAAIALLETHPKSHTIHTRLAKPHPVIYFFFAFDAAAFPLPLPLGLTSSSSSSSSSAAFFLPLPAAAAFFLGAAFFFGCLTYLSLDRSTSSSSSLTGSSTSPSIWGG